ncbi:MAG: TonB-dependent receptor, partial [Bacteroidetes bacterium]|nr:TonB-dependent receptor [Bacteroidota bacterium]
ISDRLNISLTDFYTKAVNGLNGGVQKTSSKTFDETAALVVNDDAWDKRYRRDVTLSAIARIFSDSASKTQANVYYTTSERECYYSKSLDDFIQSSFWGVTLRQQVNLNFIQCTVGGSWERRKTDSTRVLGLHSESAKSLFAGAEIKLTEIFVPSVSVSTVSVGEENSISTGTIFRSKISEWLALSAETAWYDRFPTLQERFWTDTTFFRTGEIKKEQHSFLRGALTIRIGPAVKVNFEGFKRNIENAVIYLPSRTAAESPAVSICNIPKLKIQGFNTTLNVHLYKFELNGVLTFTDHQEADTLKNFLPDLILAGELAYRSTFFKDKLDAKFGVRSRFYNRQNGMQFDPQTLSYLHYGQMLGRSTTLDLFAILKIGDAHLTVSWQNITDAPYLLSPIYPMQGRFWRLGVNWVFLD